MNDFLNNIPALVSSWSAIIFLSFAVGLLIQNRRLKKKNAEDWAFIQEEKVKSAEWIIGLNNEIDGLKHRAKILEAEKAHQTHLAAQSGEHFDICATYLEEARSRRDLLTRLLCRVYPIFHTFKNDNSKIEKHLAFLEKPKKRKSRAKVKKQAI